MSHLFLDQDEGSVYMSLRKGRRPVGAPPGWTKKLLLTGLIGLAAAAARPAAAAGADSAPGAPSVSDLVRSWTRKTPPLPSRPAAGPTTISRVDALSALAGGNGLVGRCATPLLVAVHQHAPALNQPARMLLDRAVGLNLTSPSATLASPGGEFLIHYSTSPQSPDRVAAADDDLDGVPDGVERLAGELTDVLADFIHVLEWAPSPAPDAAAGDPRIRGAVHVYLVGLGGGPAAAARIDGFVVPQPLPGPPEAEASDGVIFLDADLASPGAGSRPAIAHQVAHLIQIRESSREAPWWYESSALWLETRLAGNVADRAAEFGAKVPHRAAGPADDTVTVGLEAFLWPHYLSESTGATGAALLRRLWEEMAAVPGDNTLDAMDRVFARDLGTSLAEEIRVFNIWNLFLGLADDGQHYSFGSLLPTPQGDGTFEIFPVEGGSLSGPVSPLGAALIRVLADGSPGGLRVGFDGGTAGAWDVSLLVYDASQPRGVRLVPLPVDADGKAGIAFPWRGLGAVDLLVQNLAPRGGAPEAYSFSIDYDPLIPFDLLGFGVSDDGRGATLSWSTDREEGLAGWNVYRGTAPLGPFTRINRYLLPGAGTTGRPMSYVYIDVSVEPGHKYYYYVEGVTFDGFSENSHAAGVRMAGRERRALPR